MLPNNLNDLTQSLRDEVVFSFAQSTAKAISENGNRYTKCCMIIVIPFSAHSNYTANWFLDRFLKQFIYRMFQILVEETITIMDICFF